jgi:GT2 family glycosyltransferase
MQLSIIIVNYKTPGLLMDCLASIHAFQYEVFPEIIIVDNDSGDNSRELVLAAWPPVKWIQMSYNAGFARANNEGIRQSKGEAVLLLNSDTLIEDNAIEKCFRLFMRSTNVACGVQLLNVDKTPQISGNYFMKGGLNNLLPLPYIGSMVKGLGLLARVKKPNIPDTQVETEVDWINGAFLMVKKEFIELAGLMDEDFFLYSEETEWCSRLRKLGKLCIYGQFKVIHLQGATANTTFGSSGKGYYNLYDKKGLQIMLSNLVRIRKQFGAGWYLFHLLCYTAAIPVFFIFSFLENLFRLRNPFHDYIRAGRFAANVGKLWLYVKVILFNKAYFYKVL